MMRNIKFRAWDKSINEMLTQPLDGISAASRLLGFTVFSQCEVMQFTGLKDKKGKEIYEGDILEIMFSKRIGKEIDVVIWGSYNDEEYVSNIECWMAGDYPVSDSGGLWGCSKHTKEIIGNIHENPELLEKL